MAVLLPARHLKGPRRVPPTPVRFGRTGLYWEVTEGSLGGAHSYEALDIGGVESDSSAELERSQAECHSRRTVSGLRLPCTADIQVIPG